MIFTLGFSTSALAKDYADTESHWAKYSIDYVTNQEYFFGTNDTMFSPGTEMTRGMFVTVLSRLHDVDLSNYESSEFTDVDCRAYYASAIGWGHLNGIINGVGDTQFAPDQPITREQICVLLENYCDYFNCVPAVKNTKTIKYGDDANISLWAKSSVYRMQQYGILTGSSGLFDPRSKATRAECAAVFSRLDGFFYDIYKSPEAEELLTQEPTSKTLVGKFNSSFYCPLACCNGTYAWKTSSGVPMVVGETVAVDPSVIPLGSWVYLEFSETRLQHLNGIYHATDTGASIYGKTVDVLVDDCSVAHDLGRGTVNVYLIDK